MQKNNFAAKTFLELLEFQGCWNLIGQKKLGMPGHNQVEILNQFTGSYNI